MASNADNVRGIYATKDYAEGDRIVHVPFKLSVNLGDAAVGPPVSMFRGVYTLLAAFSRHTFNLLNMCWGFCQAPSCSGLKMKDVRAQGHATQLLKHIAGYPKWNQFMEPFWLSLPAVGQSFSKFTMTPAHLSLLQSPELVSTVRLALTDVLYEGEADPHCCWVW